jgi:hypothetical protein
MPKKKAKAEVPDSPELAAYKAKGHALAKYDSKILLHMLTTGATKIKVEFSGGGDSGQIDDIAYLDENDDEVTGDSDAAKIVEEWFYEW